MTIKTLEQYMELARRADSAEANLSSSRFGEHWILIGILGRDHGIRVSDSIEAIKVARRLCSEWILAAQVEEQS
jgi:hypothetical protein